MKILRITSLGCENGGVETGLVLLQPVLERLGHTVKTLTSNLHPELSHFSDYEFDAFENQPAILKFFYRCFYPKSYSALKKVLREYQPDIVELHTISQVSPSVLFLLRSHPTVMIVHQAEDFMPSLLLWSFPNTFFTDGSFKKEKLTPQGWLHYFYHVYLTRNVYRLGFKNVDTTVSQSRYMQSQLEQDGIKSVYIPEFTKLFDYTPINPASKTIAYVGRLEKVKGVQHIIQAFPEVLKQYPTANLVIAGTGTYESELKDLVREFSLQDSISFVGHVGREQLAKIYEESVVVVMSSEGGEAFGKVGIEAMSVGRPVISSDVGGISDWLVDGETGYLVPPADPHAIASSVVRLFENSALLAEMSKAARTQAEHFGIEAHAEKLVALYSGLVARYKK